MARHRSLETRGRLSLGWLSAMLCVCGIIVFTAGEVLMAHSAASSHSVASTSPPMAASPPSTASPRAAVEPSITMSLLDSFIVDPNEVTIEVQVARSKISNETLYILQLPGGPHAATIWKNGDGHRHFLKVTEDSCAIYDGKELHGNGRRLSVADESSDLGEYHLDKKLRCQHGGVGSATTSVVASPSPSPPPPIGSDWKVPLYACTSATNGKDIRTCKTIAVRRSQATSRRVMINVGPTIQMAHDETTHGRWILLEAGQSRRRRLVLLGGSECAVREATAAADPADPALRVEGEKMTTPHATP